MRTRLKKQHFSKLLKVQFAIPVFWTFQTNIILSKTFDWSSLAVLIKNMTVKLVGIYPTVYTVGTIQLGMIHHISVLVVMDKDQGLDEGKQTKTKGSFSREGTRDGEY